MPKSKLIYRVSALLSLATLLLACGGAGPSFPPQQWEDIQIDLETRPPQLEPGMNEFLVIATRDRAKPAHDLIVSLAINDTEGWQQAIQDGHVGVYRRAIAVPDPVNDVLFVRIEHDNRQGILRFPLGTQQAPDEK